MKKILSIIGTRPEAIKMAPLIKKLENDPDVESYLCVTAQHREMLDQILDIFNIVPDFDLDIMSDRQTITDVTTKALVGIENVLKELKPDIVLVHGDTTTALCGAMAAFYQKIDVGHVEAGLRTNNIYSPYPEEFNRQAIGLIAKYHFAPTEDSKENLLSEGKKNNIFVTGNTAIDAIHMTYDENYSHEILDWLGDNKLILLTAHRRENLGQPMENMFKAIARIAEEFDDIRVVYPIHKNPVVRDTARKVFGEKDIVKIIEPLGVYDFQNIMARSHMILTDSGGIQEEAPTFKIPVLVMRDTTERPEGIKAGTLRLVGTEEKNVYDNIMSILKNQSEYDSFKNATNPYGDGHASERIIDILKNC